MDSTRITEALTDEEVLNRLSAALNERVPASLQDDVEAFLVAIAALPPGLRAMAATYQLDVSITLDCLVWHFANWHSHRYARETARGLRELGATRAAELFEAAHELAQPYWEQIGSDGFVDWYRGSPLEKAVDPLDREMWSLYAGTDRGLMKHWIDYARRNPECLST